ncbi:MFS transporter [Yinghuangia soli]|uniref:MFS transporter n=1 Tax=Yinghuangia soli TaxID=2908204 RepID=A0AA41PWD0_9ACTN|nr:MFS transporter [Yinghuangia soli]MCF2525762.1 MFS transporter [Yinghuangia soli]
MSGADQGGSTKAPDGKESADSPGPRAARRSSPTLILAALSFAATAIAVMQTVVTPILPQLQGSLGVSSSAIAWVLTGNLLAAAVATPLIGRLGDLRGKKRYLLISLGAVAAGSVLAAVTTSYPMLVAGRVLQGLGGGVVPLALSVVRDEFPRHRTAGSIAVIGATISVGSTFGSVMTGLIADRWDYHLLFWLSALVSAISIALVWAVVPDSSAPAKPGKVDMLGALTLSGWLAALLAAVSEGSRSGWGAPLVVGGFAAAVLLFALWIWWALRCPEPLVDLRVMTRRPVLLAGLSGMLTGMAMYGSGLLFAPFLQSPESRGYGFGTTVLAASLYMLPGALGNLAAAPVAGRMINRYGPKPALILGPLLSAVSFAVLMPLTGHVWAFSLVFTLFGFGLGLGFAAMPATVNANVPASMTGVANGMNAVLRTIGGAVGAAVLGAILTAVTLDGSGSAATGEVPSLTAYQICFGLLAVACVISAVIAWAVPAPGSGQAAAAAEVRPDAAPDAFQQAAAAVGRTGTPSLGDPAAPGPASSSPSSTSSSSSSSGRPAHGG